MKNRPHAIGRGQCRRLSAALAALVALAPVHARAQPETPSSVSSTDQARQHFGRGVARYEEGDYSAALAEFNRAYELVPNWAVLYNIGQTYYQLRDYPNALRTLERYLAQGARRIPPERRARVDEELKELRGRVGRVTIDVNTPGADIAIDNMVVGKSPLAGSHMLRAGRRRITASKPGFVTASKVVDVTGGDSLNVLLTLSEQPAAPPVAAPILKAVPANQPSRNLTPAYVSLAVGGAGVVAGSVFGIMALSNRSKLDDACSGKACPEQSRGDLDALSRNATLSTIGYGVGLAGIAAGVFLWATASSSEGRQPSPGKVSAHVRIAPGGLGLSGTF